VRKGSATGVAVWFMDSRSVQSGRPSLLEGLPCFMQHGQPVLESGCLEQNLIRCVGVPKTSKFLTLSKKEEEGN